MQECYLSVCFALCGGDVRSEMEISKLRDNQSKLQFSGLNYIYSDWTGWPRSRRRTIVVVITAAHNCKREKPPKNNFGNIQLTEALKRWWWWFDFTSILGLDSWLAWLGRWRWISATGREFCRMNVLWLCLGNWQLNVGFGTLRKGGLGRKYKQNNLLLPRVASIYKHSRNQNS